MKCAVHAQIGEPKAVRLGAVFVLLLAGCSIQVPLGFHDGGASCPGFRLGDLSLDPTFGDCGRVRLDVGQIDNLGFAIQGLALDADDRVLITGRGGRTGVTDFMVARLLTNGTLDPTFGDGGIALLDVGSDEDSPQGLLVDPSGNIVVVGGRSGSSPAGPQSIFARLTSSGDPDQRFNTVGFVVADVGTSRGVCNMVVRRVTDGALICGGHGWNAFPGMASMQLLARRDDGSPEATFGTGSRIAIDFNGADEFGGEFELSPTGQLVVVGTGWRTSSFDLAIARLDSAGVYDSTFKNGALPGRAMFDFDGAGDGCRGVSTRAGGVFCVGSATVAGVSLGCAVQTTDQGVADQRFADGGRLLLPEWTVVSSALPMPDGGLLLAGGGRIGASNSGLALQVIDPASGALGESAVLDVTDTNDELFSASFDSEGRLLVFGVVGSGSGNNDAFVARLASASPGSRVADVGCSVATGPWFWPFALLLVRLLRRPGDSHTGRRPARHQAHMRVHLTLLIALSACNGMVEGDGDGGTPGVDAGTTPVTDAGTTPVTDAGTMAVTDAGTTPVTDAGTTPVTDAGTTPVTDAGTTPVIDAGTPVADAGWGGGSSDAGTSVGPTYYFSDCQQGSSPSCVPGSNSNAGTSASAPKQTLAGFNLDTVPAGTRVLFNRGGSWNHTLVRLDNRNTTAAAPLTFDAYGSGALPLFRTAMSIAFEWGGWQNTDDDRGYVFRNMRFDGLGTAEWGFWLRGLVRDVTFENVEITGFYIAINMQGGDPISFVTIRNVQIVRNRGMGILGTTSDSVIEDSLFEANNFAGSGFVHAIYLSSGNRNTVRNNRFIRNSVVNGQCTGGNLTVHGRADSLTIEGNSIEQDDAAEGCWGISISPYDRTPNQGFSNLIIRNNRLTNVGNCAICVTAAPGAMVTNNTSWLSQTRYQSVVGMRNSEETDDGDLTGPVTIQNNLGCVVSGTGAFVGPPGSTVTDNVIRTGAEASTGACAK